MKGHGQRQQQQQQSPDQSFLSSALSVYEAEVRKAISNQQQQLDQLQAGHEQLQQTLASLEQLPSKLQHQVMVPMGKHAFFPGHLTRTNEIMVHLGDQYYAEVTAGHARGILERRQATVADGISRAQQQLAALQARLDVSSDTLSGAAMGDPEAREIRSSLAESDALLASARSASKAAAAAAGAHTQQQSQQQAQRVTSSSGYSYTRPQGTSTAQASAQDDAELAALHARLEQLVLLEQQQELQDILQDTPAQQQRQDDLQAGLGTIQEGDEDSDSEAAGGQQSAARAVHRLQQLEAQSDSDDEDQQPQQQQQQQQEQQQQHVLSQQQPQPARQQAQRAHLPLQPQQQQQQQQKPLKSALKKGFLGSTPAAASSSSSSKGVGGASSSSKAAQAASLPAAFTGTVVEHPTADAAAAGAPAAAGLAVGGIVERPVQQGSSSGAPSGTSSTTSSSSKPMSKFKLRRLGLEPQEPE